MIHKIKHGKGSVIKVKCLPSVLVRFGEGGGEFTYIVNIHMKYSNTLLYTHVQRETFYCEL